MDTINQDLKTNMARKLQYALQQMSVANWERETDTCLVSQLCELTYRLPISAESIDTWQRTLESVATQNTTQLQQCSAAFHINFNGLRELLSPLQNTPGTPVAQQPAAPGLSLC